MQVDAAPVLFEEHGGVARRAAPVLLVQRLGVCSGVLLRLVHARVHRLSVPSTRDRSRAFEFHVP